MLRTGKSGRRHEKKWRGNGTADGLIGREKRPKRKLYTFYGNPDTGKFGFYP